MLLPLKLHACFFIPLADLQPKCPPVLAGLEWSELGDLNSIPVPLVLGRCLSNCVRSFPYEALHQQEPGTGSQEWKLNPSITISVTECPPTSESPGRIHSRHAGFIKRGAFYQHTLQQDFTDSRAKHECV